MLLVALLLAPSVLKAQTVDFGVVSCTESGGSVYTGPSGSNSTFCSQSNPIYYTFTVRASSEQFLSDITCRIDLFAPSTIGPHTLAAKLYRRSSGTTGSWIEVSPSYSFTCPAASVCRQSFAVGGYLALGRPEGGPYTASGSVRTVIESGTGSCVIE